MKEIGILRTPYGTKFGAPKQGGMVKADESLIILNSEFGPESLRGLKENSFIWVLWEFHQCEGKEKILIRPPKLGGNEKMGVFASRSPFRPNNIAMSLLLYEGHEVKKGRVEMRVKGADMVTETPVLDIKPYHPMADSPWAKFETPWFMEKANTKKPVRFELDASMDEKLKLLIEEVLTLDPRPGYHEDPNRVYTNIIYDYEISWRANESSITVIDWRKNND